MNITLSVGFVYGAPVFEVARDRDLVTLLSGGRGRAQSWRVSFLWFFVSAMTVKLV